MHRCHSGQLGFGDKVIFDLPGKDYEGELLLLLPHGYECKEEDRTSVPYRRSKLTYLVIWGLSMTTINLNLKITGEKFSSSFT